MTWGQKYFTCMGLYILDRISAYPTQEGSLLGVLGFFLELKVRSKSPELFIDMETEGVVSIRMKSSKAASH
jgi:hypothetical protein